jgi:hypothetical protein
LRAAGECACSDVGKMRDANTGKIGQIRTRFLTASEKTLRDAGSVLRDDGACDSEESDESCCDHFDKNTEI